MSQEDNGWKEYYQKIKGRPPRPLLLDALTYFTDESPGTQRTAIDLGCGDGTETAVLLEQLMGNLPLFNTSWQRFQKKDKRAYKLSWQSLKM